MISILLVDAGAVRAGPASAPWAWWCLHPGV